MEPDSLKSTLMHRARKLKEKMYEETCNFDYSIQKIMNQTFKSINNLRLDFNKKECEISQESPDLQLVDRLKNLLKQQFIQNIQKCKQQYKKYINLIKGKRNRIYAQQIEKQQNVQEMLLAVKDIFKRDQREKRNHSESINLKFTQQIGKPTLQDKVQKNLSQKTSQLYQKLVNLNQQLNGEVGYESQYHKFNSFKSQQSNPTINHKSFFNLIPSSTKKQRFHSIKTSNQIYFSPYKKFPIQKKPSFDKQIDILGSEKSIFVPLDKNIQIQKLLQINQQSRHNQKISAKYISKQTPNQFIENQTHNKLRKSQQQIFILHKIKSDQELRFRQQKRRKQTKLSNSVSSFDDPDKLYSKIHTANTSTGLSILANLEKRKKIRSNQKQAAIIIQMHEIPQNQIKINCNIKDTKTTHQKLKVKSSINDTQSKSTIYWKKFNLTGRKKVISNLKQQSNKKRYEGTMKAEDQRQQLASTQLDVRGCNLKLLDSLKQQKTKKHTGSQAGPNLERSHNLLQFSII